MLPFANEAGALQGYSTQPDAQVSFGLEETWLDCPGKVDVLLEFVTSVWPGSSVFSVHACLQTGADASKDSILIC